MIVTIKGCFLIALAAGFVIMGTIGVLKEEMAQK